jgi:uncharacterized membrane protein (DUF106 family)
MLETIINSIFGPLLSIPSFWAIVIISLLIALFMTLIYKWMTDQHLMKTLKDDMKKFQKEMKDFKEHPEKVLEVQKQAMETNMKYMMHSMRPTLVTFIPLILIFGWLNAYLAFEPILPNTEFQVITTFDKASLGEITISPPEGLTLINNATQIISDGYAEWTLKGITGEYLLEFNYDNKTYNKDLLITEKQEYKTPEKRVNEDNLKTIKINNEPVKPLNLFGWQIGWLGTYIIFSIIFSMILRKILKLH